MKNRPPEFQSGKTAVRARRERVEPAFYDALPVDVLEVEAGRWMRDCRVRGHTKKSQEQNFLVVSKLLWYLRHQKCSECGEDEISNFLLYAQEAHTRPHGRWGDGKRTVGPHAFKPLSRRTVLTYYTYLKIIFSWMVEREVLEVSPLRRMRLECTL